MEQKEIQFLKDFTKEATQYTAHNGKECFRQFAPLDWYLLKCSQLGLSVKTLSSGLHLVAENGLFGLEYVEGDVILYFKTKTQKQAEQSTQNNFVEISVCAGSLRFVDVSYSPALGLWFGCWLQDGKSWQVLGYA